MPNPFESITVLLVEDDETQSDLMRIYLETLGVQSLLAQDGSEAISMLLSGKHTFQAIFTDLDMPGMNGREFIKELRTHPHLNHIGVAMTTDNLTNLQNPPEAEIELRAFLEENRVLPLAKDNISPKTLKEALKDMTGL